MSRRASLAAAKEKKPGTIWAAVSTAYLARPCTLSDPVVVLVTRLNRPSPACAVKSERYTMVSVRPKRSTGDMGEIESSKEDLNPLYNSNIPLVEKIVSDEKNQLKSFNEGFVTILNARDKNG